MVKAAEEAHKVFLVDKFKELMRANNGHRPECIKLAVVAAREHFGVPITCSPRSMHKWERPANLAESRFKARSMHKWEQPANLAESRIKALASPRAPRPMFTGSFVFFGLALACGLGAGPSVAATSVELSTVGLVRATSYLETASGRLDCLFTSMLHAVFRLERFRGREAYIDSLLNTQTRSGDKPSRILEHRVAAMRQRFSVDISSFPHAKYFWQSDAFLLGHVQALSSSPSSKKHGRAGGFLEVQAFALLCGVRVTVIELCCVRQQLVQDVFEVQDGIFYQTQSLVSAGSVPPGGVALYLEHFASNEMGHYTPLEFVGHSN